MTRPIESNFALEAFTIVKSTEKQETIDSKFVNQLNEVSQSFINIICQHSVRELEYRQLGKAPKFFDPKTAIEIQECRLKMMEGFKFSAY